MHIQEAFGIFDNARTFALSTGKKPTIILKQTEHFGDTLYATPILRHYRLKYPNGCVLFVTGDKFADVHKYNPHIDKLFIVPVKSDWRASYVHKLFSLEGIDFKLAPAVIFGTFLPSHVWSLPNIFDQYIKNAGIDGELLGGRQTVAVTDKDDEDWVTWFLTKNQVDPRRAIALEYHSYSHSHGWSHLEFQRFCELCVNKVYVISLAGSHENIYAKTVDGRGMSWRRSAALLNRIRGIVGMSSGMCVLASSCPSKPFIFELNCPDSISIRKMGFSENCQSLVGYNADQVIKLVCERL
jgi:hypothetical protein